MSVPAASSHRLALAAMTLAVLIYGGQFAFVRWGLQSGLTPYDMTALRFLFAGAVMLPFFIRGGISTCAGLGWKRGLILTLTGGAGLTILSNIGLLYAPAAHASSIQPGIVAVSATGLAAFGARARIPAGALAGFAIVLAGLAAIAFAGSGGREGPMVIVGDLIFVVCGLCWGIFTWLCGRWQVPSVTGAAVVSVLSATAFLPVYALALEPGLGRAPWSAILFHGINLGWLGVALGLLLWTYGTRVLGVAVAARFPPMIPVLGALIGIPVLGEVPSPLAAAGVAAIVAGLLIAAAAGTGKR